MYKMEILPEKTFQYLVELFDDDTTRHIHDVLTHCENEISDNHLSRFKGNLWTIKLHPTFYKKYNSQKREICNQIIIKLQDLPNKNISDIQIVADLDKFQILSNSYQIVESPWEEINSIQQTLLAQLKNANTTVELQNIGNTSRIVLQKLAELIFDPTIHKAPQGVDLSSGKFKNRLHSIIKVAFSDKQFKELENYAAALIETAEKSVDLNNKLTHDLNANKLMAELGVISVLNVISIMKIIQTLKIN